MRWFNENNNNNININTITTGSRKIIKWTCPENKCEFDKKMGDFSRSPVCPVCNYSENKKSNHVGLVSSNKKLSKEWHPDNPPAKTISLGVNRKKYKWICSKNPKHVWEASPWSRNHKKSGCPYCNKGSNNSLIEKVFSSQFKQIFKDVETGYKVNNREFDIYIKPINLLVEYDGNFWHKDNENGDNEKTNVGLDNGYDVLRLRQKPLNKIKNSIFINSDRINDEKKIFDDMVVILNYINQKFKLSIEQKQNLVEYVNFGEIKNFDSVYKTLSDAIIKNNLNKNKNAIKYFDYKKNPFKPENISVKSSKKIYFVCDKNKEHVWQDTPNNISRRKEPCPYCAQRKILVNNK